MTRRILSVALVSILVTSSATAVKTVAFVQGQHASCEYKGTSLPEEVSKDKGDGPADPYYFTTYSDIEDIPNGSNRRFIRQVYNRSPTFLLPFEWPDAELSFEELGTATCTHNSFTTSVTGQKEILSRFSYGSKAGGEIGVPFYQHPNEVGGPSGAVGGKECMVEEDNRPEAAGEPCEGELGPAPQARAQEALETPVLTSRFSTSGPDPEKTADIRFSSRIEEGMIRYGFANRSRRTLLVTLPALTDRIKAMEEKDEGKAAYSMPINTARGGTHFVLGPDTNEEKNFITLRFPDRLKPSEQLVRTQVSDADARQIATCKVNVYIPVPRD
jgi:hypothetical protein